MLLFLLLLTLALLKASVTVLLPGPGTYLVDQPLVFNASHAALIVGQ